MEITKGLSTPCLQSMNTPKTLAKIGSVYIEEAILAVLEGEAGCAFKIPCFHKQQSGDTYERTI